MGFTCVIIDPTHLNLILLAWGTLGYGRAICVVAQHFCEAHNLNPTTPDLTNMIKFGTLTNTPFPRGLNSIFINFNFEKLLYHKQL